MSVTQKVTADFAYDFPPYIYPVMVNKTPEVEKHPITVKTGHP